VDVVGPRHFHKQARAEAQLAGDRRRISGPAAAARTVGLLLPAIRRHEGQLAFSPSVAEWRQSGSIRVLQCNG
jgi:hypothetical protein